MNEFIDGLLGIAFFVAIGWFFVSLRWQITKAYYDKATKK
jgi:hypothetical protein